MSKQKETSKHYDIVIVGGGMVGSAWPALSLRQRTEKNLTLLSLKVANRILTGQQTVSTCA